MATEIDINVAANKLPAVQSEPYLFGQLFGDAVYKIAPLSWQHFSVGSEAARVQSIGSFRASVLRFTGDNGKFRVRAESNGMYIENKTIVYDTKEQAMDKVWKLYVREIEQYLVKVE